MCHRVGEVIKELIDRYLDWKPDLIVYLRSPPALCQDRMHRRNRESELSLLMSPMNCKTYLGLLHGAYERAMQCPPCGCPILTLDASRDIDELAACVEEAVLRWQQ